jgi:hypothetical protein
MKWKAVMMLVALTGIAASAVAEAKRPRTKQPPAPKVALFKLDPPAVAAVHASPTASQPAPVMRVVAEEGTKG